MPRLVAGERELWDADELLEDERMLQLTLVRRDPELGKWLENVEQGWHLSVPKPRDFCDLLKFPI